MPRLWEQLQLGLGALSGRLEGPRWWKPFLERLYGEQLFLKKALQHAVRLGSPDSLGILWDDVRQGTGSRGEALRWAIENFPQQDEELKHLRRTPQQVAAICRSLRELVGAAYLAVLAKTFDPKSLGLLQRLTPMVCATWKETPPTAGSNVSPSWPREDLSDLLPEAVCDAYLKALRQLNPDVWHVASVRNDVWGLLETDRPVIRRRWMPVVYVDDPKPGRPSDQPQDKGYVAQLHVELLADGTQECFVDRLRMTLVPIDEDFASAIQTAWHVASSMVPGIDGVDVRWWLQGEGGQFKGLNGGSLGAAMGVSLV